MEANTLRYLIVQCDPPCPFMAHFFRNLLRFFLSGTFTSLCFPRNNSGNCSLSAASSCLIRPFRGFVCPPPSPLSSQLINCHFPPPSGLNLRGNCVEWHILQHERVPQHSYDHQQSCYGDVIKSTIDKQPSSLCPVDKQNPAG